MALRVGTNVDALNALRNLDIASSKQSKNVGRLSSGLRIQTAADDPSGLVMSEGLRAQIATLKGNQQTLTRADNILSTAEAALSAATDLLTQIKESISRARSDSTAVVTEQGNIDAALRSLDALGRSTSFGNTKLLDSTASARILGKTQVTDVLVTTVDIGSAVSRTFDIKLSQKGSGAYMEFGNLTFSQTSSVTFRLATNEGSVDVTITGSSTATAGQFVAARFASAAASLGVYASGNALITKDQGADQRLSITQLTSGAFTTTAFQVFSSRIGSGMSINFFTTGVSTKDLTITASGQNYEGTVGGLAAAGDGFSLKVNTSTLAAQIFISQGQLHKGGVTGHNAMNFTVAPGGMNFAIGTAATDLINVSFPTLSSNSLGTARVLVNDQEFIGGYLDSVRSGGNNALGSSGSFTNATRILDRALDQVLTARTALGGLQKNTLQPRANQVGVEINNLSAVESSIREVDFASEISDFTKNQVLFQAATSVLAAANANQATVLSLLGGI